MFIVRAPHTKFSAPGNGVGDRGVLDFWPNFIDDPMKTQDAKIEDFRFHDCRHTATTRMIAAGCSHTEVMKITGHSQLKTFLRYLNVKTETTNKVAMALDTYLSNRIV